MKHVSNDYTQARLAIMTGALVEPPPGKRIHVFPDGSGLLKLQGRDPDSGEREVWWIALTQDEILGEDAWAELQASRKADEQ